MKRLPVLLLSLALPAFLALPVRADDQEKDKEKKSDEPAGTSGITLSQFKFGKTVSGPEVTAESLKGHPVIVEFWGVNCGPCLAAMPTFNALAKRHDSKGLKVIGAESQNSSEEAIQKIVKSYKIKFPVTAGSNHPLQFNGIPHSAVFSADGALIFHGHPSDKDFDRAVRTALKSAEGTAKADDDDEAPAKTGTTATGGAPLVPERTWTNAEGKPIAAALLKVAGGIGTFRKKDGSQFTYAVEKLSSSDQELITKAQTPE